MRLAFDYQAFHLQSYGGVSRYFARLAQGLLDGDNKVGIFAPVHRNSYLGDLPRGVVHGRHVPQYPARTARLLGAYNRLHARLSMARWEPDLVHETYYSPAPAICAKPTVVTVFDMIHELYPNDFLACDNTTRHKRAAVERADHVICISESTRNDLVHLFGIPERKVSVVLLGFDPSMSGQPGPAYRTPSGRPFILYVGQRRGYKNFDGLVQAMGGSARLRHDFDLVAFGGGAFTPIELSGIAATGLSADHVVQIGGDDNFLGSLYRAARVFVYPSLYEGFGIPPLEAMAHDCPVICSNTSSLPEVVGEAAELFTPSDDDALRGAIERVAYSDDAIARLSMLGHERVRRFSWQKCAADTLHIYQDMI